MPFARDQHVCMYFVFLFLYSGIYCITLQYYMVYTVLHYNIASCTYTNDKGIPSPLILVQL